MARVTSLLFTFDRSMYFSGASTRLITIILQSSRIHMKLYPNQFARFNDIAILVSDSDTDSDIFIDCQT